MKFHFTSYPLFLLGTIFASHMSQMCDAIYIDGMLRLFRGEDDYVDALGNGPTLIANGANAGFATDTPYGSSSRRVMSFNIGAIDGSLASSGTLESGLPEGTSSRTLMGWMKPTSGYGVPFVYGGGYQDPPTQTQFAPVWRGNAYNIDYYNMFMNINPISSGHSTDIWYHVAIAYEQNTGILTAFLDGAPVKISTNDPPNTGSLAIVLAASVAYGDPYAGYLADVAIFDRALTDAEVASIYNAPEGLTATNSLGGSCTSDSNCESGLACASNVCTDGADGSACASGGDCGSGICVSNVCTNGAFGSACASGSDCSTGYCSPTSSTCATDPYLDPCYRITCSNHGKCKGNGICHCENTFIQTNDGKDCACPDGSFLDTSANRCYAPTASPTSSPTSLPVTSSPTLLITSAPTGSPTNSFENPPICENDSSYKFKLKRVQKEVDCRWISKNKKRKEKRRAKYCTEDFDNGALVTACKKSCDLCTA